MDPDERYRPPASQIEAPTTARVRRRPIPVWIIIGLYGWGVFVNVVITLVHLTGVWTFPALDERFASPLTVLRWAVSSALAVAAIVSLFRLSAVAVWVFAMLVAWSLAVHAGPILSAAPQEAEVPFSLVLRSANTALVVLFFAYIVSLRWRCVLT